MNNVVLFPQPLGPKIEISSPLGIVTDSWFTAVVLLNFIVIFFINQFATFCHSFSFIITKLWWKLAEFTKSLQFKSCKKCI